MLNKKIGMTVTKYAGVLPYSRTSDTLTSREINSLCNAIKSFELKIEGTTSWNNAQVTAGGVDAGVVSAAGIASSSTTSTPFLSIVVVVSIVLMLPSGFSSNFVSVVSL